jgi:two-component system CheB/CheR fusion protein
MPSPIAFGFSIEHLETPANDSSVQEGENQSEPVEVPGSVQREADRLLLAKYAPAAVVVDEQLDILQTRGHTGKFLEFPPGKASLNLLRMARPGLLFELQKAIEESRKTGTTTVKERLQAENHSNTHLVNVEVIPFKTGTDGASMYLITFSDAGSPDGATSPVKGKTGVKKPVESDSLKRQLNQLKQELAATKEYLQSMIEERKATTEELQSANEEIQSANEELQSTNEELQTSKEELESANEELNTVNEEMQHRNQQLSQLTNDLTNLLNSVNVAIVMVGPDLRVRRFTLQAEKALGLSSIDIGRPLSSVRFKIDLHDLEQKALDVIRDMIPQNIPLVDENGSKHVIRITPYRTSENKIEGVVLTIPEGEIR